MTKRTDLAAGLQGISDLAETGTLLRNLVSTTNKAIQNNARAITAWRAGEGRPHGGGGGKRSAAGEEGGADIDIQRRARSLAQPGVTPWKQALWRMAAGGILRAANAKDPESPRVPGDDLTRLIKGQQPFLAPSRRGDSSAFQAQQGTRQRLDDIIAGVKKQPLPSQMQGMLSKQALAELTGVTPQGHEQQMGMSKWIGSIRSDAAKKDEKQLGEEHEGWKKWLQQDIKTRHAKLAQGGWLMPESQVSQKLGLAAGIKPSQTDVVRLSEQNMLATMKKLGLHQTEAGGAGGKLGNILQMFGMGSKAAGAVSSAAAVAGPVGMAFTAGMTLAMLPQKIEQFATGVMEASRELRKFSPVIASTHARLAAQEIRLGFRTAQATEGSTAALGAALKDLRDALQPMRENLITLTNTLATVSARAATYLAPFAQGAFTEWASRALEEMQGKSKGRADNPWWSVVTQLKGPERIKPRNEVPRHPPKPRDNPPGGEEAD